MANRRAGGLGVNPLLVSTERAQPEPQSAAEPAPPTPAGAAPERAGTDGVAEHVDVSTRQPVDTSSGPIKFTFYFTPEQLDRLDAAWDRFRRQTRQKGRRGVSKSQFVRLGLDLLLEEFERDPERVMARLRHST